jgi:hypothetical protein
MIHLASDCQLATTSGGIALLNLQAQVGGLRLQAARRLATRQTPRAYALRHPTALASANHAN